VVTEQHLYLALETFNHTERESDLSELAFESIAIYALQEITKDRDEFSEEEFSDYINELVTTHTLGQMAKHGLVDVHLDGDEVRYEMTDAGTKFIEGEEAK
jgi:DNA-binding HxlR family transcriptional regulator